MIIPNQNIELYTFSVKLRAISREDYETLNQTSINFNSNSFRITAEDINDDGIVRCYYYGWSREPGENIYFRFFKKIEEDYMVRVNMYFVRDGKSFLSWQNCPIENCSWEEFDTKISNFMNMYIKEYD